MSSVYNYLHACHEESDRLRHSFANGFAMLRRGDLNEETCVSNGISYDRVDPGYDLFVFLKISKDSHYRGNAGSIIAEQ